MGSPIGPLSDNKNDNEERSYTGTPDDKVARRTRVHPPAAGAFGPASVGATAVQLLTPSLVKRTRILVQNLGNRDIYMGFDDTVTILSGLLVPSSSMIEVPFGPDLNLWGIADSVSAQNIRFWELA